MFRHTAGRSVRIGLDSASAEFFGHHGYSPSRLLQYRVRLMQLRLMCKSKIHRARVTSTDLNYVGSIVVDEDLMRRTDIVSGEKVSVWNVNNGERIETYALPGPAGSGQVIVNGAAAHKFVKGDIVIIVAFVLTNDQITPRMIVVDDKNAFAADLSDNQEGVRLDDATNATPAQEV